MSEKTAQIINALKNLGQSESEVFSGSVKSVNTDDATMEVLPDPDDEEFVVPVMLRSCVSDLKGIVLIPKVGSEVSFAAIDQGGEFTIVNASELDKVLIDVPELSIKCDSVVINGGDNGGLIIIAKLVQRINTLERDINSLKQAIKGWQPVANDGGASLKTLLTITPPQWAVKTLDLTKGDDIKNDKVKH